jgi:hypothetical protein
MIILCEPPPYDQMVRKRAQTGDGTMMTIESVVRLWPMHRVIISIQAIFMQKNFVIIADGGFRNAMLVRTGDKMRTVQ